MAKSTPAGTPAIVALQRAGVEHTVRSYAHDAVAHDRGLGYGLEAAEALGVDPARVFKTLVAEVDGALTLAVVPVSAMLDLKALAAAVGGKRAVMAQVAAAERATGYVAGGISPLGGRRSLPLVVDDSATAHATILVSAGRRGVDVELAPTDLVTVGRGRVAPIAKPD